MLQPTTFSPFLFKNSQPFSRNYRKSTSFFTPNIQNFDQILFDLYKLFIIPICLIFQIPTKLIKSLINFIMSMSSSIFASNGMVIATAMAAVSGTVILLAFRRHKPPTAVAGATKFSSTYQPRPCISIDGKTKKVKKRKKVHFAEDVMEPSGSGEEFRKRLESKNFQKLWVSSSLLKDEGGKRKISMPANRIALYNGVLRSRSVHRFAYT